jgi:hypothetical protein
MASKRKAPTRKKAVARRKAPAKKKKRAVRILAPEVVYVDVPEGSDASRRFLQYTAGLQYTTDLNGISVAELNKDPLFQSIPLSTFEKWSVKDNWGPRRRELLDRWRIQIETKLGNKLIKGKIAIIEQMEKIQAHLFRRLIPLDHDWEPGDIVNLPGRRDTVVEVCAVCGMTRHQHFDPFLGVSGDKAVDALLKLVKVREEMAEAILQVTATPGYGAGAAAGHAMGTLGGPVGLEKPKLSTDEVRSAALAILKQRRAKTLGGDDAIT